jgi:transcriptional regulator with XRE-family HTH domain
MRKLRLAAGWTTARTAEVFGCSASHISRVEHGQTPSRELTDFYDQVFEGDGLLLALFEVATHSDEHHRRRAGGHRPQLYEAIPGDATAFVSQSVAHGQLFKPGEDIKAEWRIRNVGVVPWIGRRLERQGPLTGPGLITSPRYVDCPSTMPGSVAVITVTMQAPMYDCTSVAYFKMVDEDGFLSFPDEHAMGLDILVLVRRNTSGRQ